VTTEKNSKKTPKAREAAQAAEESVVKGRRVRDRAAHEARRAARKEPKDIIVNGDSLVVVRSNSWTAELLREDSRTHAVAKVTV
jgi:hypothetical protein